MKNIVVIFINLFLFAGCSSDFIDLIPKSTATVADVYKTDKDFQDAVIGCYSQLRTIYNSLWIYDIASDDIVHGWTSENVRLRLDRYTHTSNDDHFANSWNNGYSLIYRVNYILEQIDDKDDNVVTNKQRHIGEAKFLRAIAYFDLVRIFGDIPLITSVVTDAEALEIGRDPVSKVYEQIITDLIDAGNRLPASYTGPDVGRPTKGAAKAILGKVYLTNKQFSDAETVLREVSTMGYALLPNFNDLWDYSKDEHHSEYIFDIEYEAGTSPQMGSGFTTEFAPQDAAILNYFGIIGSAGNTNNPSEEAFNLFEDNDLRKDISVNKGYTDANGVFHDIVAGYGSEIFTRKYFYRLTRNSDSPANWKVIRYADVLLMLAEVLNENNKTDEAFTYLNQVRRRAGMPEYSGLSKEALREAIYLERRLELICEGHRWWDLCRTGRAMDACGPLNMKPHMVLFPIPLSQMRVMNNTDIFPQNPGWTY